MHAHRRSTIALLSMALLGCATQRAEAWTRSFVVEWFEPAFYYGGPANGNSKSVGTDCPNGPNPDYDRAAMIKASGRSDAEVEKIMDADGPASARYDALTHRGPNGIDVLKNPTAIADPGMVLVGGTIAEGLDLDGNLQNGFVSPSGERGIDNELYRVFGCVQGLRGRPRDALFQQYSNDGMHDGAYTILIVVSGPGDERNDPNARVGIYKAMGADKMVKDANGEIAHDYSFRVDPDPRFQTVLKARVVNGLVESTERADIRMRDVTTAQFFPPQLVLLNGRVRFEMRDDGTMSGLIAGYRDWNAYYQGFSGNGSATAGIIHETLFHFELPALWYALERHADFKPDPATGKNTALSAAYRLNAIPAFVIAPDGSELVEMPQNFGKTANAGHPSIRECETPIDLPAAVFGQSWWLSSIEPPRLSRGIAAFVGFIRLSSQSGRAVAHRC